MSKESALDILQGMKQKILSIYEIIDRCKNAQSEYAQLQAERENNTRPALDLPRPNKKSTLGKKYTDLWHQGHLNNGRIQLLCIIAGTALVLAYIVLLGFDAFGGTSLFLNPEEVFKPQSTQDYIANIITFCLSIVMPVALAVLPQFAATKICANSVSYVFWSCIPAALIKAIILSFLSGYIFILRVPVSIKSLWFLSIDKINLPESFNNVATIFAAFCLSSICIKVSEE